LRVNRSSIGSSSPGPEAELRNAVFTMRSSSEWKLITATRPPGERCPGIASRNAPSEESSRFTAIRSAWKTLVAGWMSRGQALRGIAEETRSASPVVVRIGSRFLRSTTARAIRRENRSSPNRKKRSARSFSRVSRRISAAVGPPPSGSRRMSRGPSTRNEKPRAGSSSWREEIPRSSSAPSNVLPPAVSRSASRSAKSARTSRTQGKSESRGAAISSIEGSASAQTRRPRGPILAAISAACPPAPVVPSRKISPGAGAIHSNVSCKRTGM